LLKKSEAPTMILEMGFLSNKNDKEYITSEEGQNQIAETILKFISSVKK
jgi:N-acetylmuramoyl-L-alanine amidase